MVFTDTIHLLAVLFSVGARPQTHQAVGCLRTHYEPDCFKPGDGYSPVPLVISTVTDFNMCQLIPCSFPSEKRPEPTFLWCKESRENLVWGEINLHLK